MNAPVRTGQIWADTTRGNEGRTVCIARTDTRYAYCTVVSLATDRSKATGRPLKVSHNNYRGLRGYRLIADSNPRGRPA